MPIEVKPWPPVQPDPDPNPAPEPSPEEVAARVAWPWLRANCAESTWERFAASVHVRQPQVASWSS